MLSAIKSPMGLLMWAWTTSLFDQISSAAQTVMFYFFFFLLCFPSVGFNQSSNAVLTFVTLIASSCLHLCSGTSGSQLSGRLLKTIHWLKLCLKSHMVSISIPFFNHFSQFLLERVSLKSYCVILSAHKQTAETNCAFGINRSWKLTCFT